MAAFIHQSHAELRHRKTEPLYFSPVTKETQVLCTSIGFCLSSYKHIARNCLQREGWQQKKWGGQNPAHCLRHLSVNISVDYTCYHQWRHLTFQERFSSLHIDVWYNFICPNTSHWLPAPVAECVGPLYVLYQICQLYKSFWDFLKWLKLYLYNWTDPWGSLTGTGP